MTRLLDQLRLTPRDAALFSKLHEETYGTASLYDREADRFRFLSPSESDAWRELQAMANGPDGERMKRWMYARDGNTRMTMRQLLSELRKDLGEETARDMEHALR